MQYPSRRFVLAAAAAIGLASSGLASAQDFPNRPVRMIVPYAAGGGTDVMARKVALYAAQNLGQPIIVDNRPGAGTTIAAAEVARATPDGYTILWGDNATFALNPHLFQKLQYDPLTSFSPITLTVRGGVVLSVNNTLGVKTVPQLIAYAKAHPDKLSYGTPGNGTPHHLAMEAFKLHNGGLAIQHIPYKGEAPAMQDLVAGTLQVMFSGARIAKAQAEGGKITILGASSKTRNKLLPDIPTLAETGMAGFSSQYWHGLVAPAKTPPEAVAKLNAAFVKAMANPELQAWLAGSSGVETAAGTPAQMQAYIRDELGAAGEIVKAIGLKLD